MRRARSHSGRIDTATFGLSPVLPFLHESQPGAASATTTRLEERRKLRRSCTARMVPMKARARASLVRVRPRVAAVAAAAIMSCTLFRADAEWTQHAKLETAGYTDSDNVSVLTPSLAGSVESAPRGLKFGGSYLVDIVTAASVDIVSTASRRWREARHAGTLDARYKPGAFGVTGAGYASIEPDYRSLGVSGGFIQDFAHHAHSLTLGYSFGQDVAGRAGTPFSVFSNVIYKHTISPGATFTLDRATVLSVLFDAAIERGDTSKPYRYVPFFASANAVPAGASVDLVNRTRLPERALEHLPASRNRFALSGRLLHRFEHATLRLTERFYADSWGLAASTTDLRVPFDLGTKWRAFPHGRLHLQNGVTFWERAYTLDGGFPAYWAGDRELGPLRIYTLGGGAQLLVGKLTFTAQVDGILTQFLDALYIARRFGILGSLAVEAAFE
jgi:hypothetical protein